jgi:Uma2 family endonuclease
MTTIAAQAGLTEEQLLSLPHIGKAEMIDGRIIVSPAGYEHGGISMLLGSRLFLYAQSHRLGHVTDSSTGFWMKSGNLLSPDVSFVAKDRLRGMKGGMPRRFFCGSPDLVAEVLSPNDKPNEIERKLCEYFETDTRLAWIIDPVTGTVREYRSQQSSRELRIGDSLDGQDVVPGFTLPLAELFAPPDFD